MANEKKLISVTEEQVLEKLKETPRLYEQFRILDQKWHGRVKDFLEGKSSLPLTYDPFFKYIFNPEQHSDRLSGFISSLLGINVQVVEVLPTEDTLMDGETCLIMDLVARTDDGSIVNVEIQKQGYGFPGERMSCYSADLLLRQYIKIKKTSTEQKPFSYKSIKQVYVIVIFEKSTKEFLTERRDYLHHGEIVFDTGIQLHMPQKFCVVFLDVFRQIPYAEIRKNEQAAWLLLLSTESLEDMKRLIQGFPWMEEIYREIAMLRGQTKEVLSMWSEALLKMDESSLKYKVEEMQEELDQAHLDVEKERAEKEKAIKYALQEKENSKKSKEAEEKALARIAELEALLKNQS